MLLAPGFCFIKKVLFNFSNNVLKYSLNNVGYEREKMKKLFSLVLALAMMLTMVVASSTVAFADDYIFTVHAYSSDNTSPYGIDDYYGWPGAYDFAGKVASWKNYNGKTLKKLTVDNVSKDFSANLPGDLSGVDFEINLCGHTWTVTGNSVCCGDGKLIVKNGTLKFDTTTSRPLSIKNIDFSSVVAIGNSNMDGLYSDEDGVAPYIYLSDCNFSKFYNSDYGMFYLYQDGGNIICHRTVFENNTSNNDGGVIFCDGCDITINGSGDSTMRNNYADDDGGAIYTSVASGCGNRVKIKGFTFANNSADDDGGALDLGGSNNKVEECTFTGNSSDDGNDIDFYGSGAEMNKCTFTDHSEKQAIDGSYSGSGNNFSSNSIGSLISNGSPIIVLAVVILALLIVIVVLNKKKKSNNA